MPRPLSTSVSLSPYRRLGRLHPSGPSGPLSTSVSLSPYRRLGRLHPSGPSGCSGPLQPHGAGEEGSALFLVPAAVLVLAVLASIALNARAAYLGSQELASVAQTAAEGATGQLSAARFYRAGTLALDPVGATRAAMASVASQPLSGVRLVGPVRVEVQGAQVCVSLKGTVPVVFGLPGAPKSIAVSAHSTATAAGYLGPQVTPRTLC